MKSRNARKDTNPIRLGLSNDDLVKTFERFAENLKASSGNIDRDWDKLAQLPSFWNQLAELLPRILKGFSNERGYDLIVGYGREALRLYFLSLWLAEADYVNAARTILRSSLDAIALAVLLQRDSLNEAVAGQGIDLKGTSWRAKVIHGKLFPEFPKSKRKSPPFLYLLQQYPHGSSKALTDGKDGRQISLQVARELYHTLSESVHEAPSSTDTLSLAAVVPQEIVKRLIEELIPIAAGRNSGERAKALSDFAAGEMQRRMQIADATVVSAGSRRAEFLDQFVLATQVFQQVLEDYLTKT